MRRVLLLLCGLLAAAAAAASARTPSEPRAVAAGVYVLPGDGGEPNAANLGRIANVGAIVGRQGVIVIGTGASDADGERILAAVARLTALPVVLAINTYAGPEHLLGNSAFARRGIPILAHDATDKYMAANCAACLNRLRTQVGATALAGSHPLRPQRLIETSCRLIAGGRRLEILYYGPTQQPGSIAVFDPAGGVLFAGALASFDVVPDAGDADLAAWIAALDAMRRLPLTVVVPARGPVAGPDRLAETRDYLAALQRGTLRAYRAGASLFEATATVDLPRYADWALYPGAHRRNVHFEYLRLESRDLAAAAR